MWKPVLLTAIVLVAFFGVVGTASATIDAAGFADRTLAWDSCVAKNPSTPLASCGAPPTS